MEQGVTELVPVKNGGVAGCRRVTPWWGMRGVGGCGLWVQEGNNILIPVMPVRNGLRYGSLWTLWICGRPVAARKITAPFGRLTSPHRDTWTGCREDAWEDDLLARQRPKGLRLWTPNGAHEPWARFGGCDA
jgi:hypothetical protein